MNIEEQITEHDGRWYWAWQREDGSWYAPTPQIGGGHDGAKDYVCSGAAVSRSRRRDLLRRIRALEGQDGEGRS